MVVILLITFNPPTIDASFIYYFILAIAKRERERDKEVGVTGCALIVFKHMLFLLFFHNKYKFLLNFFAFFLLIHTSYITAI
jgi:hypothetical protein